MLLFLCLAVTAAVAYASVREGLLTAVTTLVNVVLAGLVTFNLFEPLANQLADTFHNTFLAGYEDATSLFVLFAGTLAILRVTTTNLAPSELELPALLQQLGSIAVAAVTGYLVAGFLVCLLQTMPWEQNFLGFQYQMDGSDPMRRYLPPDRIWLGMMHRASAGPLSQGDTPAFDAGGTFTLRYARLRRIKEQQAPAGAPGP